MISGRGVHDIDYDSCRHELRYRNLIRAGLPLAEVDRAIDMGTEVLAGSEASSGVPIPARRRAPAFALELERLSGGPVDGLVVEIVGEVDDLGGINYRACLAEQWEAC